MTFDRSVARSGRRRLSSLLAEAARAALAHREYPACEVTILITDDDRMSLLNRTHLGIPEPTDVLAFPTGESIAAVDHVDYLGDIAISLPRATAQAVARDHSAEQELQLLVVHGILHLLGHDHAEPGELAQMWEAQRAILDSLGVTLDLEV